MGIIDEIVDNMRDLRLNENFKARLIRRPEKEDCILRVVFHWEEDNFKVFWNEKFYKFPLNFKVGKEFKDKLNKTLIKQFNNTSEAPDI